MLCLSLVLCVASPLGGRYKQVEVWALKESEKWKLNIL
ncbi:hypothetical protein VCHE45_3870 [Vibrio cholerae HE-45]|nr:hypothetical protein VCHE45_3870 [Vibrio cholerae HE-45]